MKSFCKSYSRLSAKSEVKSCDGPREGMAESTMRFTIISLITVLTWELSAVRAAQPSPETVVQAQVEAYNARNIDAFLATYSDDAQLFEFPDKLVAKGNAQLRERYEARFKEEGLHADIVKRIVLGNTVVDHERVHRMFPEGPGVLEAIAIYEVQNGKIAKAWLKLGERKLDLKK